jgi:hypothetical protein
MWCDFTTLHFLFYQSSFLFSYTSIIHTTGMLMVRPMSVRPYIASVQTKLLIMSPSAGALRKKHLTQNNAITAKLLSVDNCISSSN